MYRTYAYIDGHPLARRMTHATNPGSMWSADVSPPALGKPGGCWVDLLALLTPLIPLDHDVQGIRYYASETPYLMQNGGPGTTRSKRASHRHTYVNAQGPAIIRLPQPWITDAASRNEEHETSLVSHLLGDGINDLYDVAVLVTDNPVLVKPIQVVTRCLGKRIGMLWPSTGDTGALADMCSFIHHLSDADLAVGWIPAEIRKSLH